MEKSASVLRPRQAPTNRRGDSDASSHLPAYSPTVPCSSVDTTHTSLQTVSEAIPSYTPPAPPLDTPSYSQAALPSVPLYTFVRPSVLSSKLLVRCSGIDRYCFTTDSSQDSKVWIHAGASKTNKALGCLTFPETHNTFRIHCATRMDDDNNNNGSGLLDENNFLTAPLVDVVAGIGFPHPKTFSLRVPRGLGYLSAKQELVWRYQGGDLTGEVPARYDLHDCNSLVLASLTTTKEKKRTVVQWMVDPESELAQAVLIMSAIGIVTRLSRKSKYYNDRGMYSRWRYLWWISTLSAVPVA